LTITWIARVGEACGQAGSAAPAIATARIAAAARAGDIITALLGGWLRATLDDVSASIKEFNIQQR
jgi:hypothetical protein